MSGRRSLFRKRLLRNICNGLYCLPSSCRVNVFDRTRLISGCPEPGLLLLSKVKFPVACASGFNGGRYSSKRRCSLASSKYLRVFSARASVAGENVYSTLSSIALALGVDWRSRLRLDDAGLGSNREPDRALSEPRVRIVPYLSWDPEMLRARGTATGTGKEPLVCLFRLSLRLRAICTS